MKGQRGHSNEFEKRVMVYLTREQYEALTSMARKDKMERADFIRKLIMTREKQQA